MNVNQTALQDFYREHSFITDPGNYADYFLDLPLDLFSLKEVIHGLFFHFNDFRKSDNKINFSRFAQIDSRYIKKIIEILIFYDQKSLICRRDSYNKVMVSCREYALFACAVLRQANLAARIRVFFNKFYYEPFNHDQILLEFWNENVQEWHKADLRFKLSDLSLKLAISLDFFNVQEEHYISAARAWIDCRAHPNLAMRFFGGNKKGLWYVRDRLIQDLAALNKVEMLLWDCWGLMTCPEKEMTRKNFFLLDQLAEMMLNPDQNFFELREMYFKHEEFRVPKKILSFSPAQGAVSVFIEEG